MCALLTVSGAFLDREQQAGSKEFEAFMRSLSTRVLLAGSQQDVPRRVVCLIRDLLDLRCRGWEARKQPAAQMPKDGKDKGQDRLWTDLRKGSAGEPPSPKTQSSPREKKEMLRLKPTGKDASPLGGEKKHSPQELAALWFGA